MGAGLLAQGLHGGTPRGDRIAVQMQRARASAAWRVLGRYGQKSSFSASQQKRTRVPASYRGISGGACARLTPKLAHVAAELIYSCDKVPRCRVRGIPRKAKTGTAAALRAGRLHATPGDGSWNGNIGRSSWATIIADGTTSICFANWVGMAGNSSPSRRTMSRI